MIRYAVKNDKTGVARYFRDASEALDWAQEVNASRSWWGRKMKGRRMANIIKFMGSNNPDAHTDLGEMKYEVLRHTGRLADVFPSRYIYRIRALRDFDTQRGPVYAGDLGGWVGGYGNLAHNGDCWVFDDSAVYGEARVYGDAVIRGGSKVTGTARRASVISGMSDIRNGSSISGCAVSRQAVIDRSAVYDSHVTGRVCIEQSCVQDLDGMRTLDRHLHMRNAYVNCASENNVLYMEGLCDGKCLTAYRNMHCDYMHIMFDGLFFEDAASFADYVNDIYFFSPYRGQLLGAAEKIKQTVNIFKY